MNLIHKELNDLKSYVYYVYLYIDPRNKEIFYIGKGKGKRLSDHLKDKSNDNIARAKRIADIRLSGQEPQIDFLGNNLSNDEALLVEAAAINLIDKSKLTNKNAGNHQERLVRVNSEELIRKSNPEKPGIRDISSMVSAIIDGVYAIKLDVLDNGHAYFSTFSESFEEVENLR